MQNLRLLIILFFCCYNLSIVAQTGYQIEVQIDDYEQEEIVLAYQFMDRYPVIDTARINTDGKYVFAADSSLIHGVYMLVLPPDNEFVTLLINPDEQRFSVRTSMEGLTSNIQFVGSTDNRLYYEYMNYLNLQAELLSQYRAAAAATTDPAEQAEFKTAFNQTVGQIKTYQQQIVDDYPQSLTASLILLERESEIPDYQTTSPEEKQYLQYRFRKDHYFDEVNWSDERLLRSEALFEKVDYYLNRLTHAQPDSIALAVDYVLDKMQVSPKTFKYYLDHFMLTYASSDIVGMDAVYVHIVENYYAKGKAPWVEKTNLEEMVADVQQRKHLLLGKTAPDIQMELRDGTPISLHGVEADFTILYLWQPKCSHCKAAMPYMKDFYKKYQTQSVEVFAACTKIGKQVPTCWEYIDENEIGHWVNTVDPFLRSRFVQLYMAEKTPKIYILDENKRIVMKDIGAEQLDEVMSYLIGEKQKANAPAGKL